MTRPRSPRGALPARTLVLLGGLAALLVGDGWLAIRVRALQAEAHQFRTDAFGTNSATADAQMAAQKARLQSVLDRVRAEAGADRGLHLSIDVDSGSARLERDGLVLHVMDIDIGPESVVGIAPDTQRLAAPRGIRAVRSVVAKGAVYELPAWLWRERGRDVPASRKLKGALGLGAAVLEDGTLIYARTTDGPLADSLYVWPGAVRLAVEDLKAVLPNLKPGVKVYLF